MAGVSGGWSPSATPRKQREIEAGVQLTFTGSSFPDVLDPCPQGGATHTQGGSSHPS